MTQKTTPDTPIHQDDRQSSIRQMGLNGNYWYAVEQAKNLKKKQICEAVFWKTSIALFRDETGQAHAIENRCAHRQLRLTELGHVEGDRVVCGYHGWSYNDCGKCVAINHHLGHVKRLPKIHIRQYPVREKYDLIWLFPGDPALADTTPLPSIPMLDGENPWPFTPVDITIGAHHSMILENVCDFNHEYLHQKYKPFTDAKLSHFEQQDGAVELEYQCALGQGPLVKYFSEAQSTIKIRYDYPHQTSDSNGKYLHWMFMTPIDEQKTRCIFLFLYGPMRVPFTRLEIPHLIRKPFIQLIHTFYINPLLVEDQKAVEAEQRAYQVHAAKPSYEFNPVIGLMQKLTREKWEGYLHSEQVRMAKIKRPRERLLSLGAGQKIEEIENTLK